MKSLLYSISLLLFFSLPSYTQVVSKDTFYFEKSSFKLNSTEMNRLIEFAHTNQFNIKKVNVIGHTDAINSLSYNQKLSEQRAEEVAKVLHNISLFRSCSFNIQGVNYSQPAVLGKREADKALNRRVEVTVSGTLPEFDAAFVPPTPPPPPTIKGGFFEVDGNSTLERPTSSQIELFHNRYCNLCRPLGCTICCGGVIKCTEMKDTVIFNSHHGVKIWLLKDHLTHCCERYDPNRELGIAITEAFIPETIAAAGFSTQSIDDLLLSGGMAKIQLFCGNEPLAYKGSYGITFPVTIRKDFEIYVADNNIIQNLNWTLPDASYKIAYNENKANYTINSHKGINKDGILLNLGKKDFNLSSKSILIKVKRTRGQQPKPALVLDDSTVTVLEPAFDKWPRKRFYYAPKLVNPAKALGIFTDTKTKKKYSTWSNIYLRKKQPYKLRKIKGKKYKILKGYRGKIRYHKVPKSKGSLD